MNCKILIGKALFLTGKKLKKLKADVIQNLMKGVSKKRLERDKKKLSGNFLPFVCNENAAPEKGNSRKSMSCNIFEQPSSLNSIQFHSSLHINN